jgi:Family of unknown function (DUF6603)
MGLGKMSRNFQEILLNEIRLLLLPLAALTEADIGSQLLSEAAAWELAAGSNPASDHRFTALTDAYKRLDDLIESPPKNLFDFLEGLESLRELLSAARQIPAQPIVGAQAGQIAADLIQALVIDYSKTWHPSVYDVLVLLAVIRPPVTLSLQQIPDLLRDPMGVLRAEYLEPQGLATAEDAKALTDKLFPRLAALFADLGFDATYLSKPEDGLNLGEIGNQIAGGMLTIFLQPDFEADDRYGVRFALSSKDVGDLGLVVLPFGEVLPYWDVDVDLTDAAAGFAIGPAGLTMFGTSNTTGVNSTPGVSNLPGFAIGSETGTRIEVRQFQISGDIALGTSNQEYGLLVDMGSSALVISGGDGDGFLQTTLPAGGVRADFDLAIGWSNKKGLYFRGSATVDATLSVGISIGDVITIPTVHLSLQAGDAGLVAEVSISVGLSIGPVQAVADRVGLVSNITFPPDGGNLGVADLAFAFKPPSGIGLAVDAAGVSGGGFLGHDDTKHEYSGVLQLQFTDLALQAFGLITTQVAGGEGYSLLAMIDADFPPVQLGWGFTLNGVGGLLAVHRTASVDALHAALKADKLGTILFPKNAITNAPQILAELDTLFPTAPGRFLFGPMALIGWGTPSLLTVALAIIIELPEPIRIILLARLAVRLPSESDSLVRINMDALGVLDLGQDSLSLDATLFDSRLLKFALSGDMALRATWGGEPREFLLSVGGFHPRFTPPTGFPTLKRMSIDMTAGSIAKLHLESYLAITSNTLQIGANLHLLVKISAFSIDGHLGFDALFQRNPFHFDGDISGSVAVSIDGDDLLSVSLDAMLTGPAPWQVSGSFKVHIIFVDVSKSFSHTWGDSDSSEQIAPVDVGALLNTELADPRSWGVQLAAGTPALISSRAVQNAKGVVAHPLAQLEVHERTVPLGMDITRFGGAPVTGASNFTITDFRIGGAAVPRASVQDDFAAAQFLDLTDDEKLAQPSFELHDAGVRLSGGLVNAGAVVNKTITYETFYVDEPGGELRTDPATPPKQWQLTDLQAVLGTGSAGRATILSAGNRRYTTPGNPIQVTDPAFVLVNADTLAPVGVGPASGSVYSNVQALMNQEIKHDPSQQEHLQIVATHEMVAA